MLRSKRSRSKTRSSGTPRPRASGVAAELDWGRCEDTVPTLVDQLPGDIEKHYDWIGFDPRGVGASRPAVHCDPDNELLYRVWQAQW